MPWPIDNISTANVDSAADNVSRADFLNLFRVVKAIIAGRGTADGIASLDSGGKVPAGQINLTPAAATLADAATIVWNAGANPVAKVTLGGNRALSISGAVEGAAYYLWVRQDATGNRTLALPASDALDRGLLSGEIDLSPNQITLLGFVQIFGKLRLVAQRSDFG